MIRRKILPSFGAHGGMKLFVSIILLFASFAAYSQSEQYKQALSSYQEQDFRSAETLWSDLAKQGDINAQYALGVMELRGETVNASPEKAFSWFRQAAVSGHTTAMFNVGVAYWDGSGVRKNRRMALRWWEKSAAAGDSGAQFNLGLAYYIGEERESNLDLAARWIGKAAEQNHPEAQRIYKIILQDNPQYASLDASGTEIPVAAENQQPVENQAVEDSKPETSGQTQMMSTENQEVATVTMYTYWRTAVEIVLHTQADASSPIFYTLPQGSPVEILEEQGEWSRITLPDGLKTWVFEKYLNVSGSSGVITGTGVRVRPKPSTDNTNSPPVGAYRDGERVTVLEHKNQWYSIRAPKHIGGWVNTNQLEKYQDAEESRNELWNQMIAKGL